MWRSRTNESPTGLAAELLDFAPFVRAQATPHHTSSTREIGRLSRSERDAVSFAAEGASRDVGDICSPSTKKSTITCASRLT
jgi:hypothetical protein